MVTYPAPALASCVLLLRHTVPSPSSGTQLNGGFPVLRNNDGCTVVVNYSVSNLSVSVPSPSVSLTDITALEGNAKHASVFLGSNAS